MDKEQIQNLIKELIEKTGVVLNTIAITEETPTNTWYSVEVAEPHLFIGRDAEALYALNHLVRRIIEGKNNPSLRPKSEHSPFAGGEGSVSITIDINNFQKKRVDDVRAIAHMMSERARYFKSNIEIDPMSAFERRVVHEFLSEATDLKTESVGMGPTRRVVIKYVGTL